MIALMKKRNYGWLMAIALVLGLAQPAAAQLTVAVKEARQEYATVDNQYQIDLNAFEVARQQYEQIPTNANMNVLLTKYKAMLAARTRVWWSFLQALKTDAGEVPTIQPEKLTAIYGKIEAKQAVMQTHIETVNQAPNREAIGEILINFKTEHESWSQTYYPVMVALKVGKLRYAIQELRLHRETLLAAIPQQVLLAQVKEQRLRGLEEVAALLNAAEATVNETETQVDSAPESQAYYLYDNAKEDLTPAYDQIQQASRLLSEISAGIEL